MPRPRHVQEHGREAVHRHEDRRAPGRLPLVQGGPDLVVVGVKDRARARFRRAGADVWFPGMRVRSLRGDDRVGGVQGAVAVDDQPRVPLQHGVRAQRRPQALRDARRADVPGDVAWRAGPRTDRASPANAG